MTVSSGKTLTVVAASGRLRKGGASLTRVRLRRKEKIGREL